MAESIITLGIGATPVSLTPFITTGLLIGEPPVVAIYTVDLRVNPSPAKSLRSNPSPTKGLNTG